MRPSLPFSTPLLGSSLAFALALMATPGLAQTAAPETLQPRVAPTASAPTYTLIHVNAAAGSNINGDGSQQRPYQTITHALGVAPVNAVVLLAPGEYSEASGEQFPIQLRPGVTVQGLPNSALGQTVIRGSGSFASATAGLVQTTLVGADGSGLGHVTVTNTSTAGYGLVIEAGRSIIRQNQFVGSGYSGVYVSGASAPRLEGNQFQRNGVVGLVLEGQTTAEVQGNRFEQTGIGIRVAPGAQPQIMHNTIVHNQDGLLLDGNANPILQDNVISQNRRNGVVEFQTALKAEEPAPVASRAPLPPVAPGLEPSEAVQAPTTTVITMAPPQRSEALASANPAPGTTTPATLVTPPPHAVVSAAPATPRAEIPQSPEPEVAEPEVTEEIVTEEIVTEEMVTEEIAATPLPPTVSLPEALPLQAVEISDTTMQPLVASPAPPDAAPLATGTTPITAALPATANLSEPTTLARAASDLPAVPIRTTQAPLAASAPEARPLSPSPTPAASSPEPAAPTATVPPPSDTVLAARDSFRRWRQSSQGDGVASVPTPTAEDEAGAIPITVIPPPTTTLARASETPSQPTASASPAPSGAPSSSAAVSHNLLPVPSRTIPRGEGSSSLPNLAPPATTLALNGASSTPPSYGGLLGLAYTVVVPAADAETQAQVRATVADAFRVNLGGQTVMQVGAYADQATAEARANELIDQGFAARVEYRP